MMHILALSIERLDIHIEKTSYLNVFEGKMTICSLNCDLYDRGLVV